MYTDLYAPIQFHADADDDADADADADADGCANAIVTLR